MNRKQDRPYILQTKSGVYAWCACGKSKAQPFCDGSHVGSNMKPVIERVKQEEVKAWCGCKQSKAKPFCDGSHSHL